MLDVSYDRNAVMPTILLDKVSKIYADKTIAVNELNISIFSNTTTVLLGPNGAGKSTLMRLMATLTQPTNGSIYILGQDTRKYYKNIRKQIGFVGQNTAIDKSLTVEENLYFSAKLRHIPKCEIYSRVQQLIEQFKLQKFRNKTVLKLSGGIQRRIDIAMAIIHHPKILFLDEPTTNLDPESRVKLWESIDDEMRHYKMTVVYSTHSLEEADKSTNQIILIDYGKLIVQGSASELKGRVGHEALILDFNQTANANYAAHTISENIIDCNAVVAHKRLLITVKNPETHLSTIRKMIRENNLDCHSITLSHPSLNDVYFLATGEHYENVNLEGIKNASAKKRRAWND